MSKKLPFEEALSKKLNDVPRPDENDSWQKMKKLLDQNDDRKPAAPLWKNYKTWALLAILLIAGIWLAIDKSTNNISRNAPYEQAASGNNAKGITEPNRPAERQSVESRQQRKQPDENSSATKLDQNPSDVTLNEESQIKVKSSPVKAPESPLTSNSAKASPLISKTIDKKRDRHSVARPDMLIRENGVGTEAGRHAEQQERTGQLNKDGISSNNVQAGTDSTATPPNSHSPSIQAATEQGVQPDTSAAKMPVVKTTVNKIVLHKTRRYLLSAGVGIQQQIQVGGQQSIHYGFNKTNRIADYIPSAWFRFEKQDKWYLQGEFIYAAPQLVKEFAYSQQTRAASNSIVTTTLRLRKTFFSEVPVSLNYYVQPNWSVGAGATYSWFHGAIAEKETVTKGLQSQSLVNQIVPITGFTDSFLYRSHAYVLLQTDYQWKQLSLGLRYSKDIQPYITYTLPDGRIADEKNWSLELFLRLRLWKSAGFSR